MITKRKLDKKIEGLSEFASSHLTGLQKQVDDLKEQVDEQKKNLHDLEDFCTTSRDIIRAIIKHLHIPYETMRRLLKEVDAEWHTDKYSDLPGTKDLDGELEKEADLFNQEEKPKKKRTKAVAPSPEMRQMRSWARRYGWSQREFHWGMAMCGIKGKGGEDDVGSCWLTPGEATAVIEKLRERK